MGRGHWLLPARPQACPGAESAFISAIHASPQTLPSCPRKREMGTGWKGGGVFISPSSPSHCDLIEDSKEKVHLHPSPWFLGRSEQVSLEELSEGAWRKRGRVDGAWCSEWSWCLPHPAPYDWGRVSMCVSLSVYRHLASHPRCPRSPPGLALAGTVTWGGGRPCEPDFLLH